MTSRLMLPLLAGIIASVSPPAAGTGYLPSTGPATLRFRLPTPPVAPLPPKPPQLPVPVPPSPAASGISTNSLPEGVTAGAEAPMPGASQAGTGAADEAMVQSAPESSVTERQSESRIEFVTPQHLIPFFTEEGWKGGMLTVAPVSFVPPHPAVSKATYQRVP